MDQQESGALLLINLKDKNEVISTHSVLINAVHISHRKTGNFQKSTLQQQFLAVGHPPEKSSRLPIAPGLAVQSPETHSAWLCSCAPHHHPAAAAALRLQINVKNLYIFA